MTLNRTRLLMLVLKFAPLLLFLALFIAFGLMSDRFYPPTCATSSPRRPTSR